MKSLGWDAAIAACQAGQADGMIAGASITDERKASGWTFSDGYYDATQTMTVAEDSDITGFADLNGQTVAVKTGKIGQPQQQRCILQRPICTGNAAADKACSINAKRLRIDLRRVFHPEACQACTGH